MVPHRPGSAERGLPGGQSRIQPPARPSPLAPQSSRLSPRALLEGATLRDGSGQPGTPGMEPLHPRLYRWDPQTLFPGSGWIPYPPHPGPSTHVWAMPPGASSRPGHEPRGRGGSGCPGPHLPW